MISNMSRELTTPKAIFRPSDAGLLDETGEGEGAGDGDGDGGSEGAGAGEGQAIPVVPPHTFAFPAFRLKSLRRVMFNLHYRGKQL